MKKPRITLEEIRDLEKELATVTEKMAVYEKRDDFHWRKLKNRHGELCAQLKEVGDIQIKL